jgi:hypothetical protein
VSLIVIRLEAGMRRYAPGKWAEIKADPEFRETVSCILETLTFLTFSFFFSLKIVLMSI